MSIFNVAGLVVGWGVGAVSCDSLSDTWIANKPTNAAWVVRRRMDCPIMTEPPLARRASAARHATVDWSLDASRGEKFPLYKESVPGNLIGIQNNSGFSWRFPIDEDESSIRIPPFR